MKELFCKWLDWKQAENVAREERLKIESELAKHLTMPVEGSATIKKDGFKVVVTQRMTRVLDEQVWSDIENQIPADMRPIKITKSIDTKGVKWLQEHRPEIYHQVAKAITTKPQKPGFKVEEQSND